MGDNSGFEVQLAELREQVDNLTVSMLSDRKEPYAAFEAKHGITGIRVTQLRFIISGILSRARGEFENLVTRSEGEVWGHASVREAHSPNEITYARAAVLVGEFLGAQGYRAGLLGCEALDAHWQRGFDDRGHAMLRGLPSDDLEPGRV